jgi:endonuclease/exonuclease/phosphatase family metal-dependent hydrolase
MESERDRDLRVVSYNIHRCVGCDGQQRPRRIANVLERLDFDIAGLQEVESSGTATSPMHQLAELAHYTRSHAVAGATVFNPTGDYGNGLLVRGKALEIVRHDLSVRGSEPRGALDVTLQCRSGRGRVVVTHLGLGITERRAQIDRLLRIVARPSRLPTLLLGDFNEWFPWARGRRRLIQRFGAIPLPRTFPTRHPVFALDHVWVCPRRLLVSLTVDANPLTRLASDHLPVLATVRLPSS